jgi:thymidylate kinase
MPHWSGDTGDRGVAEPVAAMHPLLERLFASWERGNIRWCFLRVPADLLRPDSDLDLLIDPVDLHRAIALAQEHQFVRLPRTHRDAHLVTYDRDTATWLWLHCVTELALGPYHAVRGDPASAVLQRRTHTLVPRLAPQDEFWVTLAHCVVDRRNFAPRHRRRLGVLAPVVTADTTMARSLGDLLPAGQTADVLLRAAKADEWASVEKLAPDMVRACMRRARPGLPWRVAGAARSVVARLAGARIRRGMSVALLGPDGAGKSTLARGIEHGFPFPVRQVYMGLTGGMLQHADRLRLPGLVRLARLSVLWARYLRAQYHISRGRLVIFDRYIYDAAVPTPHHLGPVGRLSRWLDGHSCPAPDLSVLLDAPGAVMHQRKGEYDPEMLEHWRQRFLSLRRRVPDLVVVDATRGADDVRAEVLHRVWQRYAGRWGRS